MKHVAIVLSAGKGSRMNSDVAKQYLELCKKPVICHTLESFEQSSVDEVILVTAPDETDAVRTDIVERYHFSKVTKLVAGGKERADSVYEGIKAAEDADFVHIHDGARCLITPELIDRMVAAAGEFGAAVLAVKAKDTIRVADSEGFGADCPDRNLLWAMQTPQSFSYSLIRKAFDKMYAHGGCDGITDDVMVLEKYGSAKAKLVEGSYENFKITTPEDLALAEIVIGKRNKVVK